MRIYLTNPELATAEGKQLLELALRIVSDGELDQSEIQELQNWLALHKDIKNIAGIPYLDDILKRISSDDLIDPDEALQLHLAIERVIPAPHRTAAIQARKQRESEKASSEENAALPSGHKQNKIKHVFAKVAGVTFPNDDGSERQSVLRDCRVNETIVLVHDPGNSYSSYATKVLRTNGAQLGHAPEYLAERLFREAKAGYQPVAVITNLTGGTRDKPRRGANFVVFFCLQGVTSAELSQYAATVLDNQRTNVVSNMSAALTQPPVQAKRKPWWKFW